MSREAKTQCEETNPKAGTPRRGVRVVALFERKPGLSAVALAKGERLGEAFLPILGRGVHVGRNIAAFSLIEVMCAILIMGVALVALTRGITTALASTKDAEVATVVPDLAAGQVETVRAEGVLTDDTTEGDFGETFPKFKYEQTISPAELDGLHQVEVTVEDARTGAPLYKLTTLLFDNDYPGSTAEDEKQKKRDLDKAKKRNRRGQ